jgi:hypothetical protein
LDSWSSGMSSKDPRTARLLTNEPHHLLRSAAISH